MQLSESAEGVEVVGEREEDVFVNFDGEFIKIKVKQMPDFLVVVLFLDHAKDIHNQDVVIFCPSLTLITLKD